MPFDSKLAWEAALNLKTRSGSGRLIASICALTALAAVGVLSEGKAAGKAQAQAAAAPANATSSAPAKPSHRKSAKAPAEEALGPPNKGLGNPNAPIVMEVFSDYMCPQCRNFYMNSLTYMIQDYVANGKVYLVHRDFPLPIAQHKYNWDAARWGTAAARIGRFEEVDRALYENEPAWEASGDIQKTVATVLSPTDLKRVQKQVAPCLTQTPANLRPSAQTGQSCSLDAFINQDIAIGKAVPVQATPTYVITSKGNRLPAGSGFVSWPIMKQFIDSLLSQ
jgi:protein-disulfide isomerase